MLRNVALMGSAFAMVSMLIEGAAKDQTFTIKVRQAARNKKDVTRVGFEPTPPCGDQGLNLTS